MFAKGKFCLSLHYNADYSYLFINWKKIYKIKASNKNNNLPPWFCLGSISDEFDSDDLNGVSFKGNVYDFSVDCSVIGKSNILNSCKYLMIKNSILVYKMFEIIKKIFVVLSSIVNASNQTKCISLSNQKCKIQPTLINLHPNEYSQEFHCYPFAVKLDVLEVVILLMIYPVKYVFHTK